MNLLHDHRTKEEKIVEASIREQEDALFHQIAARALGAQQGLPYSRWAASVADALESVATSEKNTKHEPDENTVMTPAFLAFARKFLHGVIPPGNFTMSLELFSDFVRAHRSLKDKMADG